MSSMRMHHGNAASSREYPLDTMDTTAVLSHLMRMRLVPGRILRMTSTAAYPATSSLRYMGAPKRECENTPHACCDFERNTAHPTELASESAHTSGPCGGFH
eukprot:TRINITY_DN4969_c0_g1_i4.p5 TRINITY_DN4969_c0_g1~~TRINITY_DN4969_c0_g1_i4.p5  ORF type:complete len:102 (-),score=8.68 TRINITY_DN4969_c0_g1_i4:776-1081(-)